MATKGTKAKKVQATEAQATLEAVKDLDLTTVIGEVGNLQVTVQNSLASLSALLTGKIQQVETIDTAIDLKQDRLQELFGIENEAISIDDLRAQREEELRDWQKKKQERDTQWTEELSDREKFRKREADEYLYTTKQTQKRIKDEFDSEIARQKREEQIRQEMLQREWAVREEAIANREDEVAELQTKVSEFDNRLKTEVSKAEAIVGNTLKRQHEHELALLKKDAETAQKMSHAHVQMQQTTINSLQDQIRELQVQLIAARSDAREVASQALQSASGRQVVEALQRVADNQTQTIKTK
jgi:hypothetical protein